MSNKSQLAEKIEAGYFVVTAEYLPKVNIDIQIPESLKNCGAMAINVSDNPNGPILSSLAASIKLKQMGIEPIYQIITRDRNRIALQSDILGAASWGIKNILCLSGYHQILTSSPQSLNVYDLDSIQLIQAITKMNEEGVLLEGTNIEGDLSIFIGATANPYLKPMELNMIRLSKKVEAGAKFIQTQPVFDITLFQEWLDAANNEGLTEKAAIIASVLPLTGITEAENIMEKHTEFSIPDSHIKRMKKTGNGSLQKKMGITICTETISEIKEMKGVKGLHIMSGGKEESICEIISTFDL